MPTATLINPNPSKPGNQPQTSVVPTDSTRQNSVDGPSNRVDLINSEKGRILCIADIRGRISQINQLAKEFDAIAVIHSGDFGFYERSSLDRISDRTLRHLIQYSSLITSEFRSQLLAPGLNVQTIRQMIATPPQPSSSSTPTSTPAPNPEFALSEFPDLLTGKLKLDVPVYTVWGACEDVAILEKVRAAGPSVLTVPPHNDSPQARSDTLSVYSIPNLTVLDEATTRCLVIGGVRLRLFGLGGAVVPHKLFDNGEGGATIAGGQGTMWTSVLQVGEVVDTAQRVYDPTETRLLVSHASPGREGLLAQLALVLKADLTISAGLHFRYGVSYNEFSVQHEQEAFRTKLHYAKAAFNEIWDTVKGQVEAVIDDHQRQLLSNALAVANRVPAPATTGNSTATEEPAWKNSWNWNLPDAAFGSLILDIKDGRIGAEMRSQGFNFAYRAASQPKPPTSASPVPGSRSLTNSSSVVPPSPLGPSTGQSANTIIQPNSSQSYNTKPSHQTPGFDGHKAFPTSRTQSSDTPGTSTNVERPNTAINNNKSYVQGSSYGSQGGGRYSHTSQHHRQSKSREDKREDGSRMHSAHSSTISAGAPSNLASNRKSTNSEEASANKDLSKTKATSTDANAKPSAAVTSPTSGTRSSEHSGQVTPVGPSSSSSPAPSRKSSFANKKKKNLGGSHNGTVKTDNERSNQDKNDSETNVTAARSAAAATNEETKEKSEPTSEDIVTVDKGRQGHTPDSSSGGPNGSIGSNNHYRGRGGSRGRGGPGSYNMRNSRGGRGGRGGGDSGREGFNPRPVGPGLVGPALAGAGIGNKTGMSNGSSANNNNSAGGDAK